MCLHLFASIHIIYVQIELANKEDSLSYDLALTSPSLRFTVEKHITRKHFDLFVQVNYR